MNDWNHAYYQQNGDDIVCSNCGYVIGWGCDYEKYPNCGSEFVRFDGDDEVEE